MHKSLLTILPGLAELNLYLGAIRADVERFLALDDREDAQAQPPHVTLSFRVALLCSSNARGKNK